jgi:bifunctional DNase/RNase
MDLKSSQNKIWTTIAVVGLWFATLTCSQAGTAVKASPTGASESEALTRVNVYRLSVDPASQQPVVTLVDSDELRVFPIWIGLAEARAIHSELEGRKHFRPLTHDLLARIIDEVDGKIQRVVITRIEDNVFFATLEIKKKNGKLIEIDARPSDSIVLALKFDAPIFIDRNLFDRMSIPMEASQGVGDRYGFKLQDITPELAKYLSLETDLGVMVSAVSPGSRAYADGIQSGDVLLEIGGHPIADVVAARELLEKSKGPLPAKIMRGKRTLSITLNLH